MKQNELVLYAAGLIPVTWIALLAAPAMSRGLPGLIQDLPNAMSDPFHIQPSEYSLRTVFLFAAAYVMGVGIWISTKRNYRRGEEMGSAEWGDARRLCRKYRDREDTKNKILTQNVKIGLDGRKHRRNLNVLVCGGSGAGKTRFYCKPNIMQANTSMVVLDPKGQLKYARALNLPLKFTYFRERRWQKWLNLRLYGILPSTSDSLKMMNLRVNLTVFPIRKST